MTRNGVPGMTFEERNIQKGFIVGHITDEEGRRIEVRHDTRQYMCVYKDTKVCAPTSDELISKVEKLAGFVYEWQDVIYVNIEITKTPGCPSTSRVETRFEKLHISKTASGKWVSAHWNPDAAEHVAERYNSHWPGDMTFPYVLKDGCDNNGHTTMILPLTDDNLRMLREGQLTVANCGQNTVNRLLGRPTILLDMPEATAQAEQEDAQAESE